MYKTICNCRFACPHLLQKEKDKKKLKLHQIFEGIPKKNKKIKKNKSK